MQRFTNKKIVVTGGTSGIGLAGVLKIVEEGGQVLVTGRNEEKLRLLRKTLPNDCVVLKNDMCNKSSVEDLRVAIESWSKSIDGLWLNAGIASLDLLEPEDQNNFWRMIEINLYIPRLQMATIKSLIKTNGSVVVTSSSSVYERADQTGDYAATKAGLISEAKSWSKLLGPKNIRVNTIIPGATETNFRHFLSPNDQKIFENNLISQVPLGRIGQPEEVAEAALFLLSDQASYITGSQLFVDGGLLRR